MSVYISTVKYAMIAKENNKKVAYESIQPKNPVRENLILLCFPGLGDLRDEYRFLVPLFADRYRMILCDYRGMGDSDTKFSKYTADVCGDDLIAILDQETRPGDEVVILGNSLGGASAMWVASERPALVKGIVLLNAFVRDHPMPFGVETLLWLLFNNWTGPSFWASYYQTLYTKKNSPVPDLKAYSNKIKENLCEKHRMASVREIIFSSKKPCTLRMKDVAKNHVPILAIYGDKDPDFKDVKDELNWIESELKRNQADFNSFLGVTIPEVGHYPHVENPNEVAYHLKSFLTKYFP